MNLIEPKNVPDEDIELFRTGVGDLLSFIKVSDDKEKLISQAEHFRPVDLETAEMINLITDAGLKYEVKEGKVDMCKAIQELRQEEREKGMEKGLEKGLEKGWTKVWGKNWKKGRVKESFENWYGLLCVLAGGQYGKEDIRVTVERLAKHSPITLLNGKCPPTICLYGETGSVKTAGMFKRTKNGQPEAYAEFWKLAGSKETPPEAVGMDGIVATQNYVTLTNGLAAAGVPFAARLEPYPHCQILSRKPETRPWLYENLRKYLKGREAK